jgi:hypothetical protein
MHTYKQTVIRILQVFYRKKVQAENKTPLVSVHTWSIHTYILEQIVILVLHVFYRKKGQAENKTPQVSCHACMWLTSRFYAIHAACKPKRSDSGIFLCFTPVCGSPRDSMQYMQLVNQRAPILVPFCASCVSCLCMYTRTLIIQCACNVCLYAIISPSEPWSLKPIEVWVLCHSVFAVWRHHALTFLIMPEAYVLPVVALSSMMSWVWALESDALSDTWSLDGLASISE